MWLFSTDGFASVVKYDAKHDTKKDGVHYKIASASPEVEWLIIRARIKADLEQMEKAIGADFHIISMPSADYSHRALVSKEDWKKYLVQEVDAIDYDSHFKEVTRDRAPKVEGRYSAMMQIWGAFAKLQDTAPYSGIYTYGGNSFGDAWGDLTEDSHYLARGNNSTTTPSKLGTVTGNGYPWDRGKNVTTQPAAYTEELVLSDTYVTVAEMAKLLAKYLPQDVPQDELDNADDDAFSLWIAACDAVGDMTVVLSPETIEEIAGELGLEVD